MASQKHKRYLHVLPLLVILGILALFFGFRLDQYFSFQNLQAHHALLIAWTSEHLLLAVGLYVLCYIVTIMCALPSTLFFSLTAGFLFGVAGGFVCAVGSAVVGAAIFFVMVKTALAEWLKHKMSQRLLQFEKGFQANAFNYILMCRLVPIFPFFIVNIAAALLDARLSAFWIATLFGIMPNTLVYVSLGHGMEKLFDENQTPNLAVIFQPHLLLPLLLLALLAIAPVIYKKMRKKPR